MKILPLIGMSLKADEMLDLLESEDVEVVYDFDRLRENMPDIYWASFKERGFIFRFDEEQKLNTAFFYIVPDEGCAAVNPDLLEDVPILSTWEEVGTFAASCGGKLIVGEPRNARGPIERWAKVEKDGIAFHYGFSDEILNRVTVFPVKD